MKRLALLPVLLALALLSITVMAQELSGPQAPAVPRQGALLQVAHLAPFADGAGTAVTITLDSTPVLTGFAYAGSTGYVPVPAGEHLIEVYPAGSISPAISATVTLSDDMDYTAIATGDGVNQPLALQLLQDDNTPPLPGQARVRIGHLAPFAATITGTLADVRLQDGTVLLDDVPYGAVADYLALPAGVYDLMITTPDGGTPLIDPGPVVFNDGDILSGFAVGDGTNQPLGVFALPAGSPGFMLLLAAQLQVAHLAPFAAGAGTAVTVTLDSTPVLTDFVFAESTGYLPVPEGLHLIEVFPASGGTATPAITATVLLTQGMEYTVIATGDGANQPLALQLLQDDNIPPLPGQVRVRIGHLAPFSGTITGTLADVRLQGGLVLLDDVPYGVVADYVSLPADAYDLQITTPDGSTTLIDPLPVTLDAGGILSIFAVGDGANQPLGVFALPAGMPGFMLPLAQYDTFLPLIFR